MTRKRMLACGAAAAVLALPGAAIAASQTYTGAVTGDPKTSVKLKAGTDAETGNRFLEAFKVRRLAVSCDHGATEARVKRARLSGLELVGDRGRFRVRAEDGARLFKVRGRIGTRRASGVLRYSGPTEVGTGTSECDSGKLRWRVAR